LRSNVACQTVSNALLKSNAKTTTNGLLESKSVTECRKAIRASVVEPVGRKAYWSVKLSGDWSRRCDDGRIEKLSNYNTLKEFAENWSDGNGSVIRFLVR